MSGIPYLSADQLLDAHNAAGMGVSLEFIAGKFGVTVQQLRAAMGLPPKELIRICRECIEKHIDDESLDRHQNIERLERQTLTNIVSNMQ